MSEINETEDHSLMKSKVIDLLVNLDSEQCEKNARALEKWFGSGDYLKDLQQLKEGRVVDERMDFIVEKLKELLPWNAVLSSETINNPSKGPNSDCKDGITYHLDGFMYEDSDVENVLEKNGIQQAYCGDCGSKNIKDIVMISHSLSRCKLQYIFNVLLPKDFSNKKLLDVGSRIGAVLYGAFFYTDCPYIFGIELNKELCDIQNKITTLCNMESRVKVINGDVVDHEDVVASSDVTILNNVFEFFVEPEAQIEIWRFLKRTLKKGSLIITVPSLEESLDYLEVYNEFSNWAQTVPAYQENKLNFANETMLSFHDIYLYIVK